MESKYSGSSCSAVFRMQSVIVILCDEKAVHNHACCHQW